MEHDRDGPLREGGSGAIKCETISNECGPQMAVVAVEVLVRVLSTPCDWILTGGQLLADDYTDFLSGLVM